MIMLSLALSLSALADDVPSDAEIYERLIATPEASAPAQRASAPWWMWPMGLLGAAGAAGAVMRTRKSDGIPGDINVLSRAGLSRTASLAMIEVTGADGQSRRMLIGVGGGAPRLVADLSATPSASTAASVDWFEESIEEAPAPRPAPKPLAQAASPEPVSAEPPRVGQRLSVTTPEEPGPDPLRAPRGRAARAYGRKPPGDAESLNLVAEVLAERGQEKPAAEAGASWSDPWAKNFEALLGRRSV